jgi:hypothetical protein
VKRVERALIPFFRSLTSTHYASYEHNTKQIKMCAFLLSPFVYINYKRRKRARELMKQKGKKEKREIDEA